MSLTSLARVKRLLRIPADVTGDDAVLQDVIDAAESLILEVTSYVLTPTTRTEIYQDLITGVPFYSGKRPVANLNVSWKSLGDTTWETAQFELLDSEEGKIILLPESAWPPVETRKWSLRTRLPLVRLEYTAQALSAVPAELEEAASFLSVYWWTQSLAGSEQDSRLGDVSRSVSSLPVPGSVWSLLSPHIRGVAKCV